MDNLEMRRPVVLVFVAYYLPAYKSGGPVRAIENLVNHLGKEIHFKIICNDRDATDKKRFEGIAPNRWTKVGGAEVYYLSPGLMRLFRIFDLIYKSQYDSIYINSLFDPVFSIFPLLIKRLSRIRVEKTVLAPRGELAQGALELKQLKKRAYLVIGRALGLFQNLLWQASNSYEINDILREFDSNRIRVRQAIELPPGLQAESVALAPKTFKKGLLKILYLSRISRDKNLHFALEVLKKVSADIEFNIAGPIREPDYWEKCRVQMESLPKNISVSYLGPVEHSKVLDFFVDHDLFFLPTVGENYGYVIPEAMSVGTPVLISDRAGWRNLAEKGGGWDLPLEQPHKFVEVIHLCSMMSYDERSDLRKKAASYFASERQFGEAVSANRSLFIEATTTFNS